MDEGPKKPKFEVLQGGKSEPARKQKELQRAALALYENPNLAIEMITSDFFELLLDNALNAEGLEDVCDEEILDRYGEAIIIRLMYFLSKSKAQKVYHSDEIHDQLEEVLAEVIKKKMGLRGRL